MKRCFKCKTEKPINQFNKNRTRLDQLQHTCNDCIKKYQHEWYLKNKTHVFNKTKANRLKTRQQFHNYLKGKSCVDCGINNIIVLHFDHLKDKKGRISKMVLGGYSWNSIKKEISKCEIVCSNCHMIRTSKQFNWTKNRIA